MSLFKTIEVDEETEILHFSEEVIQGLNIRFEVWTWDGIKGHSAIFIKEQVADKTEDDLVYILKEHLEDLGRYTYSDKGNGFIYISYGFDS